MVATVRGLDVSNWQGELSVAQAQDWAARGIGHVVVRCSLEGTAKGQLARRQLQAAQAAGLTTSVYVWAYFRSDDPVACAQQAIALVGDLAPLRYWIDAEDTAQAQAPAQNIAWLRACLETLQAAGCEVGIYTGAWFWRPYMGNTGTFASYPLWTAQYDGIADLSAFIPYGGWTACVGKQITGSAEGWLPGQKIDFDVFNDGVLQPANGGDPPGPGPCAPLTTTLAYLQHDVADALQSGVDGILRARSSAAVRQAIETGVRPALATLRTTPIPEGAADPACAGLYTLWCYLVLDVADAVDAGMGGVLAAATPREAKASARAGLVPAIASLRRGGGD